MKYSLTTAALAFAICAVAVPVAPEYGAQSGTGDSASTGDLSALPSLGSASGGEASGISGILPSGIALPTGYSSSLALPTGSPSLPQESLPALPLSSAATGSTYRSLIRKRQDLSSLLGGSSDLSGLTGSGSSSDLTGLTGGDSSSGLSGLGGLSGSGTDSLGSLSSGLPSSSSSSGLGDLSSLGGSSSSSGLTGSTSSLPDISSLGGSSSSSGLTGGSSGTPDLSSLGSVSRFLVKKQDLSSLTGSTGSTGTDSLGSLTSSFPSSGSSSGLGDLSSLLGGSSDLSGSGTDSLGSLSSGLPSSSSSGLGDLSSLSGGSSDLSGLSGGSSDLSSLSGGSTGLKKRQDLSSLTGSSGLSSLGSLSSLGGSSGISGLSGLTGSSGTSSAAASTSTGATGTSSFGDLGSLTSSAGGSVSSNDVSDNTGCKDVTLIFARGTTETGTLGTVVGPSLASNLKTDTGSAAIQGVDYPADAAGNANLGASGGPKMADLANQALKQCPDTKIVLGGYSQGAMVVHNALSSGDFDGSKVAAIAAFGDPLNGEDFQDVDSSKVVRYCGGGDAVCDTSGQTEGTGSHLSYSDNTSEAAQKIADIVGVSA